MRLPCNEQRLSQHNLQVQFVRNIGHRIIDFLAQIENFQKRLFEKKKFVIRTDYCITIDRVPKELWDEVLQNRRQLDDWRQLYGVDPQPTRDFLREHPYLVVDTRYFSEDFKWRLLAHFDDLDEALDGLLIKSENFQALNLLMERYRGQVKCIYIDPPYNTRNDEFIYKDSYQHSSWLTMMENRLALASLLMNEEGNIFVSIDGNEQFRLKHLLGAVFGKQNVIATVPVVTNLKGNQDQFAFAGTHEYVEVAVRNREKARFGLLPLRDEDEMEEWEEDEYGYFKRGANLKATGVNAPRSKRPNLFYPIYITEDNDIALHRISSKDIELLPITNGQEMSWRWSKDKLMREKHNIIVVREGNEISLYKKQRPQMGEVPSKKPKSVFYRPEYSSGNGTAQINNLFGDKVYLYPKPVDLIIDFLLAGDADELILDFFAGSGTTAHAVINLNREDGGRRKYILVEMGDYFETVLLKRIKKVVYSDSWKDGKPQKGKGISHFFKYLYLEQYEDTLNNLELPRERKGQLALERFGDEYLLRCMLKFETQDIHLLLNHKQFQDPFNYKIKIWEGNEIQECVVDLVETFNYLLGIHVKKMRQFQNNGRLYRAVLGEKDSKSIVVVWRTLKGLYENKTALRQDEQFIEGTVLPALIGENKLLGQNYTVIP
jgi:adenine-specific DNA-methyltransferase